MYWLSQFCITSFSLLQGRGNKDIQFYRPEGNRGDWCVKLSSPCTYNIISKKTIKSLWAAFMWNLSFPCGPKKKKWEIEDVEAKASYAFCETAGKFWFGEFLPSQQCHGTRGPNLLQHRMCSLKKQIQVQCFGIFHSTRLFLHHSCRTEFPAFFQESKGKIMTLMQETPLRPFPKLWGSQTFSSSICSQELQKFSSTKPVIILVTI